MEAWRRLTPSACTKTHGVGIRAGSVPRAAPTRTGRRWGNGSISKPHGRLRPSDSLTGWPPNWRRSFMLVDEIASFLVSQSIAVSGSTASWCVAKQYEPATPDRVFTVVETGVAGSY